MSDDYGDPNEDFVRGYNAGLRNGSIARQMLHDRITELEAENEKLRSMFFEQLSITNKIHELLEKK